MGNRLLPLWPWNQVGWNRLPPWTLPEALGPSDPENWMSGENNCMDGIYCSTIAVMQPHASFCSRIQFFSLTQSSCLLLFLYVTQSVFKGAFD